jgi:hypothetical protein
MVTASKGEAMERRRIGLAVAVGALLLAGTVAHPHANLVLQMHEAGDRAPSRMQAALDVGVLAISVLVTWTRPHGSY